MATQRRTIHDDGARTTDDPAATTTTRASRAKVREAVEARDALADALTRAGVQLPAMDVRTPWQDLVGGTDDGDAGSEAVSDAGSTARYALIHLGVCSAPIAHALAAVIVKGTGR
ncbi:hypothetical protein ABZW18_04310 [Streptomyces sp. NPDC004647]|uniref:hypothetical protein n=1 Tax=Streptomyces sp. NPDC004647 TaxID=3154671 RepID=UPI00339F3F7F